ncbi:MAG: membrane protein insertase YidC [Parvibaculum sp.]|uniref:membrane protein insertase YidC n=1 Tax=Parvibaculum sp. TaxID=2024848 RepID=UPI0025CE7140|nr:membrane protein insertase YidC [Parvibaculum sp.]MCE9650988.1 membrane protein insertase YidC [Parvibaculum sp.]
MGDNRNFLIAILLSVIVFIGWQHFFVTPRMEAEKARQQAIAEQSQAANPAAAAAPGADTTRLPTVAGSSGATITPNVVDRDAALAQSPRVEIASDKLDGSIALKGARFDDLHLRGYHETVDKTSPEITLFSPAHTDKPYFSEFGFIGAPGSNVILPGTDSVWTLEKGKTLTPSTPVTLAFDNGQGVVFHRTISLDENFLFTIADTVENKGASPVTLYPYGLVSRTGQSELKPFYILHEGFIGEFKENGEETIKYAAAVKDNVNKSISDTEGWLGITDKYWASALIPQPGHKFVARFSATPSPVQDPKHDGFQADYRYEALTVAPGSATTVTNRLFAGAKVSKVIDGYRDAGIYRFNLLIDWGYFWFLTQPVFKAIDLIAREVGNFGIAILIITVLIKLAFFPLANRSYESMSKMKKLQPQMEALRERYKDDKMKQQQEIMDLYKREKVNPIAGCLPIVIQIPVFFSLYKVLFVTIEMRHAPFFGWIHDLSAPDPTSIFNLMGLIPWDPSSVPVIGHFLMLGIWPLIMGFTMFVQQRMNPAPADPIQQQIFMWMPVLFTFMLAGFPAGLVIYWAWNNTLSVLQQGVIMRRQGVPIEIFSNLGLEKFFKKAPADGDKS